MAEVDALRRLTGDLAVANAGIGARLTNIEGMLRDLRDDGVAKGGNPLHPIGNPMSHSTQSGFKAPLTGSEQCTALPNVN